ncbi:MFS family permease [Amycolatopsis lexingtonensis]|uniref:Multidrug efflux pump Tap n=1 Tax=Amycolatopsis lexingtonensis TaxID=218822 RepID=A0ABR9HXJ4_9PSEU|nr:MFS transporter [Amycolatopsis lexingtonensis]MBE1495644.1 MFS family permease [Amycolatopsis lexingtonensis]
MATTPTVAAVLRIRPFRRLWLVLAVSSTGDWLGLLATSTFAAARFTGPTAQGAAFGGVMAVRLLPALLLGPVAGVLADRFDRRHTMIVCDLLRFLLFASIPAVGLLVADAGAVVAWAAIATFGIEALAMVWSPARDAAVPTLVPREALEAANRLSLATTYGVTPVVSALAMAGLYGLPDRFDPVTVALLLNSATFLANAGVLAVGVRELSGRGPRPGHPGVRRELGEAWRYVRRTPSVRGLVTGILVAFAGAGAVIGAAQRYARTLGDGDVVFALLFAALFAGMALGVGGGPLVVHALSRRRWFALSIVLAGFSVAVLAVVPDLGSAVAACVGTGAGAGMTFLVGWTLLGSEVGDDLRGRVFGFVEAGGRVALLVSIALASVLVGLRAVPQGIPAARVVLLGAGGAVLAAGWVGLRRIDDRPGTPVLRDLLRAFRKRSDESPRIPGRTTPSAGRSVNVPSDPGTPRSDVAGARPEAMEGDSPADRYRP